MSEFLSRDAILGAVDTRFEIVDVPEWGGKVRLKGMTAAERDNFEASIIQGKGKNTSVNHKNMRAKLLVRCIVDADGNRLFGENEVNALGEKSASAINRVFNVAQELVGIGADDVEELTEAFDDGQSGDSDSA